MGNIFAILLKVFPILFFILLEIVCFFIIFKNNEYYQANILNKSSDLVGGFHSNVKNIDDFLNLKNINTDLTKNNADLMNQVFNLQSKVNMYEEMEWIKTDTNKRNHYNAAYTILPAEVVYNSTSKARNLIIINKGKNQGVNKDMGVLGEHGPIGVVIETSDNYSCVMSLLNRDANFSCKIQSTQQVGQLRWHGTDIRIAQLEDIPKHIKLKKGDIIETSAFSTFFPENIRIGRVLMQKDDKESNFSNIKILLDNDFLKLKYVYLVKSNNQTEFSTLLDKEETIIKSLKNE